MVQFAGSEPGNALLSMGSIPAQAVSGEQAARVLFLCAFSIGLIQLLHPVGYGLGPGYEMAVIARNLVNHGTFGNPFDTGQSGPTAVVPPLHPMFLAACLRLLPVPWSLLLPLLGNITANAVTAALMPRLSERFCSSAAPGVFSAILWLAVMQLMPAWDAGFTLALLVIFFVLTSDALQNDKAPLWAPAGAGLMAGLISNENPAIVLVFIPWIFFLLIERQERARDTLRYLTVFTLLLAAANLPWIIRNYRIWHTFTLRTNFGMTFYSSNNDCAEASLVRSMETGCYQRNHPAGSAGELALLKQLGEVEFDRERTNATIKWIRSHPVRFRDLTLVRVLKFWFPDTRQPGYTRYTVWLVTALSIPGVVLMLRRRVRIAWLVLIVWTVYPLTYYIVVSDGRYRYPIMWASLLPAGYFLSVCWSYSQRRIWGNPFATLEVQGG